ncbi:MAG: hypothetical protein RIS51_775 [Actinomycetota bacterium]
MIPMTLGQIAAAVSGKLIAGSIATEISGNPQTDSREVSEGAIFFAKVGATDDGHNHLAAAKQNGAALAIVQREVREVDLPQILVSDSVQALNDLARHVLSEVRSLGKLQVVGITGSNGKTSTKNMLREVLSKREKTIAPRDSFNNEVGLPVTVCRLEKDTRYLVLELGAAGLGSIDQLASWTTPDIGVELKVGMAHAGAFGSIQTTALIKAELMPHIRKVAILNLDDPYVSSMQAPEGVRTVGFGISDDAGFQILGTEVNLHGTKIRLKFPDGEIREINLRILGEHQAMNVAASLAVLDELGVDRSFSIETLQNMEMAERWRMQLTKRADGVFVINDAYNASPDSMRAALQTLATIGRQGHRTIAVLGEMAELGDYAVSEHDQLGRLVVRYNIDQLFVVGERAKLIHMGATQEGSWGGESSFIPSISEAFPLVNGKLSAGDVVLVKSSNAANLRFLGDELAEAKS